MGYFDEQIRNRIENDQQEFEDSIFNMASSIIGKKAAKEVNDDRIITRAAIEEIIKYYGFKPKDKFGSIEVDTDLQSVLKPYDIAFRPVELDEEWTREAFGPMLGYLRSDNTVVALLPDKFNGYYYKEQPGGKKIRIGKRNADIIQSDAVCFYRPLPAKKLGIRDLLVYMSGNVDLSDIAIYILLVFIFTMMWMMVPALVDIMSGIVLDSGNINMLVSSAVFLIVLNISSHLINTCSSLVIERIDIKMGISVEAAVMNRVLNLPAGFFKDYAAGELSAKINSVSQLCNLLLNNIFSLPVVSLFSLLYIYQINNFAPELVVPAVVITVITLVFSIVTIFIQANISGKIMQYDAEEDGISFAMINGIQKIRLAGAEKRAFAKWANCYKDSADLLYGPPLIIKINNTINVTISIVGTIVLYTIAANNGISSSDYLSFTVAYGLLTSAFAAISQVALATANIKPILNMAEPILKAEPENSTEKAKVERLSGSIELSNVHFRYSDDSPKVLDGISFKIKSGEYVAIVGKTGCGKSTLIRLLLGYETPGKGAIYYDGKDIARLDMASLRRKIGVVTQNGGLFSGDIFSNIVITKPELDLASAWEAAEIAGIAEDIRKMPMGMNTYISEGQGGISGGQKQRLMIARAVAPKPKILLLDEATSALDNITQKKVSESLDKLKCTRIVIAHRLSTIKNCDRILVMDEGKIVEEGKYNELIAAGGYFAKLVERQQVG